MTEASEQRRAEWAEHVEYYAREAVVHTRPFAEALVALVAPPPGARVLDVASGPGVAAVAAARRVGPGGAVVAADFIPEWEPHVAAAAREAEVATVTYATMPADALAFPDASFDAVLCSFGLMFVPEPVAALREMRRVLRPGGTLGVVVWSVPEKVGLFLMARIVGAVLPPPAEAPPSPLSLGAPGLIEDLVADAGFRNLRIEHVTHAFEQPDPETAWRQWSEGASPAAAGLARLSATERERVRNEVITALEEHRQGDAIRVPSEAILVTATT
jgi:SAM-dependent methyltransferase